jgi:hypothetical protein
MEEALQRVAGSPLDRELEHLRRDDRAAHVQSVPTRLKGLQK